MTPPRVVQEAPPPPPAPVAEAPTAPPTPAALTEEEIFGRKTLDELNAEKPLADAFFDFDQWQVREDERAGLQKNAEWLRRWPSTPVTIEGHCDARGMSEYNLALGDRRGNAVRSYLISLGIAPDRLLVVSKGEEAPFCAEDGEDCWHRIAAVTSLSRPSRPRARRLGSNSALNLSRAGPAYNGTRSGLTDAQQHSFTRCS